MYFMLQSNGKHYLGTGREALWRSPTASESDSSTAWFYNFGQGGLALNRHRGAGRVGSLLEPGAQLEERLPAFAAAGCNIDAREGLSPRVHAHAKAVAFLELAAVHVLVVSSDFASIDERCEADVLER